jgi:integrase
MWKHSAGERPNTVTVFEREAGGPIYARIWDGKARGGKGSLVRLSLGHRDKARAKRYAIEEAAKLQKGQGDITTQRVTLTQIFAAYLQQRSPMKVLSEQQADKRRAEMWARVLGSTDPYDISSSQWDSFIDARSSGQIDPRGNPIAEKDRKAVRARSIEGDCVWLWLVFNWATTRKLARNTYLMRENPIRGYDIPHEKNPLRPVATQDRFDTVRAISDKHTMEIRRDGKRITCRSYLSELLDIAVGTGRRLSAVCSLCFQDLRLERTATAPHGAIVWPANTDKTKRETTAPLMPSVRAAIDRIMSEHPGIGQVPLFPSGSHPERPMTRHLADSWLREAETMAGLQSQKGSLWHAYRRKWATERKHLPPSDVAKAGGWASTEALTKCYIQADEATMLAVVLGGGQLREMKA